MQESIGMTIANAYTCIRSTCGRTVSYTEWRACSGQCGMQRAISWCNWRHSAVETRCGLMKQRRSGRDVQQKWMS